MTTGNAPLTDAALDRLRRIADWPDLEGTRYELREPLGRGGMGTVYLAHDRDLDRDVAIKVLSEPDPDPGAVDRLLREARIIARLEHPGIVPVHDAGRLPDGRVYYAMKRIAGTRLDARAREGLALFDRLRLFERVIEPVAFAHAHGVLHRDLKPENIMVGSLGEVLVLDWGLAIPGGPAGDAAARGPQTAAVALATSDARGPTDGDRGAGDLAWVGTPGYMSPEQAAGNRPVDERSDVYSLGAVLYFLLRGRAPEPEGPEVTAGALRRNAAVPAALAAICARALAHDPVDRYGTAVELRDDIGRFLRREPVRAHRETVVERARRLASRHRTAIALVAAYLGMRALLFLFAVKE